MRSTIDVLSDLRRKMDELVVSYPPHIHRVDGPPIVGTAFFPGGCGLWSGVDHFAPAPEVFPESPTMFVGHNYSGAAAFAELRSRGGESSDWNVILLPLLSAAGINPASAFFTNVLMGLKDGASVGDMKATPAFEAECSLFLLEQIRIVQPSVVVTFGNDAYSRVRKVVPRFARCTHFAAREFVPRATRADRIRTRAAELVADLDRVRRTKHDG